MSNFKFKKQEREDIQAYLAGFTEKHIPNIVIDRIEQIISERDGWIDVKDRLPEKQKQVAIRVTGNSACVGYIHDWGHWIIQSLTSSYKQNELHKITHWQPLT